MIRFFIKQYLFKEKGFLKIVSILENLIFLLVITMRKTIFVFHKTDLLFRLWNKVRNNYALGGFYSVNF